MKEKIANVIKTILRVCIKIVAAIALIAFLVVPFLSNKIDHSIAQWIWYPAVSIYSVFAIIGCFNNKKQTFQDKMLDFFGKLGSILIIPVVVSIFVFNYYEINHIWLWVIFAIVLVLVPGALIAYLNFDIKHNNRTKEEIGIAAKNIIKHTFLFWLYDLTYMAIFNNWLLLTYILGILSVGIVLVGLARTFIFGNKSLQFMLYIDLIIGVGLSIYLIYIIPDKFISLQTIVTTIVAAIYGGLLTLVGVAWTIKQNNEDRKNDAEKIEKEKKENELKLAKPLFAVGSDYSGNFDPILFSDKQNANELYRGEIINSENSTFYIESFLDGYGNEILPCTFNGILRAQKAKFGITAINMTDVSYVVMSDTLDRKFYYCFTFAYCRIGEYEFKWLVNYREITEEDYFDKKKELQNKLNYNGEENE